MKYGFLALLVSFSALSAQTDIDLAANEKPLSVERDGQAIAKIPAGYRFVEPGTLTVAISALNSPPLALLASSLGLKLKLVPTAWEDWPLGITSGRYCGVAIISGLIQDEVI